jgi:hypothetical protein
MDRELRDWLRSLADPPPTGARVATHTPLTDEAADYLARIATDGTLKAAFAELAEREPDLAG